MELNDATNQVAGDDTDLSTVPDNDGVSGEETNDLQFDDDGNPIEDNAEEEEEIELDDDLKLKLPKSQVEKLRLAAMRQADYTKKTQELSEARKAFEAERQSTSEADQHELTARANIAMIDRQLTQYAQVNWNAWNDTDPFEAQKAFQNFQLLKDARGNAQTFLERAQSERTAGQRAELAKAEAAAQEELTRDLPGWSPQLAAELMDFGIKTYGLSKEDFDSVVDARAVKLLHAARQWHQHEAKTKKAQSIQKQQEVTPAATVGKGKAPPAGLDDRLSIDEWNKRRTAQLAKRA